MRRFAIGLLAAAACSSPTAEPVDSGPLGSDGGLDLARARWVHEPVYVDSATSVSSSDLAISDSGEMIAVWAEDLGDQLIETAIFVADSGPAWDTTPLMVSPGNSFTRPSVFAGNDAHVAASANFGGASANDVFYARRTGGTWSQPINLTAASDPGGFVDHDPEVLETPNDVIVLFRNSDPAVSFNDGIEMFRFTDPSNPGPRTTILSRANFDCSDFEAALGDDGAIHIVANCTEEGGVREVYYLTNKSGVFVSATIAASNTTGPLSPDIAITNGGDTVHLLWNASTDCGGITCRDVYYSQDLQPPVSVSGGEEDGGFIPHVGVDKLGRVLVAFHRLGDVDDVMWSYSENSNSFVRVQLATPGTPDSIDSSVGNLVIHPLTGIPHIVYNHSLPGPGGSNVFHGRLVD